MGIPNFRADFEAWDKGAPVAHKIAANLESVLTALCAATGIDPGSHVDGSGPPMSSVEAVPPLAQIAVQFINPAWDIQITNPQYLAAQSGAQLSQAALLARNKRFADIVHELQWSSTSDFSTAGASQTLPRGKQTHYTPTKPSTTFWRVRSSFDGFNFNAWSAAKNS